MAFTFGGKGGQKRTGIMQVSSVVERSLHKFCLRGPQFDPRKRNFFSDAINLHVCLTEIPTFGRVLPINATSTRKAVVASLLGKKDVA